MKSHLISNLLGGKEVLVSYVDDNDEAQTYRDVLPPEYLENITAGFEFFAGNYGVDSASASS